jgi:O-antigen/teichoic acid export membrane protein
MLNFLKQFLIYGFASVLSKIAAVFLLPLYTNVLSQEEYGALAMITAAKGIIDLFSNLNIHSGVARDYYEKDIDRTKVISTGFFSIIFVSLLFMFIMLYSRDYWITNVLDVRKYEKAFIFMLFTIPAGSLFSYFAILTRYKQKVIAYSLGSLLQLCIQIGLTVYFILIVESGIVGVFYGMLAGELIGIIYFYLLNREYIRFTFHKDLLKRVLKYSLPTLPAIAAIWVDSNLGQLFIGKYISLEDAGIYSIALRIASVFMLIQQAFGNVWLPFVYENLNKPTFEKDIMRIFNAATFALVLISVNLSVLSKYIVLLLSTPEYIDSAILLTLLTIPMSISILNQFASIGPNISRKTKYISYANISGSVVNISCLVIFMPIYGIIAVPLCLLLSRLIVFLLTTYYTKKEIRIKFSMKNVIVITLVVLLTLLFSYTVKNNLLKLFVLFIFNGVCIYYFITNYNIKNLIIRQSKNIMKQ